MNNLHHRNLADERYRDMVDEERIAYNWQQIASKRARPAVSQYRPILAVAGILFFVAASAWYAIAHKTLVTESTSEKTNGTPLSFVISDSSRMLTVPTDAPNVHQVPLSDGSTLTLSPGARLAINSNTPSLFRTTLHKGWVRYNVIPGRKRVWELNTNLCRVVVLGTQFTVNATEKEVNIVVHRGKVSVYPPKGDTTLAILTPGKPFTLQLPPPKIAPKQAPKVAKPSAADREPPPKTRTKSHPKNGPRRVSGQALAGLGASEDVNALLAKVDDARKRNNPARAAGILEQIVKTHPSDPAAGLLSLTLGKIRLDRLHQPQKAVWAFEKAAESKKLPRPLQEQAFARCIEAYSRAGKRQAANELSVKYHKRFPKGTWSSWIRRWTTPK